MERKGVKLPTSSKREEDEFDKREDAVVFDVAWLTESLLQLLLHIFFGVQQIDLCLLQPKKRRGRALTQQKHQERLIVKCQARFMFLLVTYFF